MEGHQLIVQSNPILQAQNDLSVPNSYGTLTNGQIVVGTENWSPCEVTIPKGTCIARCRQVQSENYEILTLSEKAEAPDKEFQFDCCGFLLPLAINPTLTSPINDIEGLDLTNTILSDEQISHLHAFLHHNRDVFSIGDTPGLVHGVEHEINTGTACPISVP